MDGPASLATPSNIVDDLVQFIARFLADYGWYLVFSALALYLAGPYIEAWRRSASLRDAKRPERVAVLDEDLRRARMRQQLDVFKANRTHKEKAQDGDALDRPDKNL
jgi:hypothetical protein